jgi:hypothetical protein
MYGGCLGACAGTPIAHRDAGLAWLPYGRLSTNLGRATGFDRVFHFSEPNPDELTPIAPDKDGSASCKCADTSGATPNRNSHEPRALQFAKEVTDSVCRYWSRDPFFVWAHYMDLHWPYHLEEELVHPRDIGQAWQDLAIMYGRSNFDRDKTITNGQRDHFIDLYEKSLQYSGFEYRLMSYMTSQVLTTIIDRSRIHHGRSFRPRPQYWESNLYDEPQGAAVIRIPNGSVWSSDSKFVYWISCQRSQTLWLFYAGWPHGHSSLWHANRNMR